MQLFLIRHGESFVNLADWTPGGDEHYDAGLTDLGKRQAAALAAWMPQHVPVVDALYASTMQRARETVIPLAQAYGVEVTYDDRLREVGNCLLDHSPVPLDKLPRSIAYVRVYEDPYLPVAQGIEQVETYMHFRSRVGLFMSHVMANHAGQTVVVVCHGGIINAVFDHVFNVGAFRRCDVWSRNTAITLFEHHPARTEEPWILHFMGRTHHFIGLT